MSVQVIRGDCRDVLKTLPDQSVHCVVTSPPYWGLRDYGTATWDGGDQLCNHRRFNAYPSGVCRTTEAQDNGKLFKEICGKCGARRIDSQIGLEPSPDAYVATMVEVFREVRRVLRDDGTLWLNLGDSYSTHPPTTTKKEHQQTIGATGDEARRVALGRSRHEKLGGLPEKNLIGIPWRVALALQADGWWLRQDIIWSKPNPMPESVTDRCTKAHEYIFMLSKSGRYYYDAEAIKEPMKDVSLQRLSQPNVLNQPGGPKDPMNGNRSHKKTINNQAERLIKHEKWKTRFEGWDQYDKSLGRNKRSVWEVATAPFSEAHFATFPPALIEPCIMAGCPEKCCAKCGAPSVRQTQSASAESDRPARGKALSSPRNDGSAWNENGGRGFMPVEVKTLGFLPSCFCNAGTVPGTVLDPFGGAGTTGLVADRLGRNAILIELNPEYAAMAGRRITDDAPLFAQVAAE